MTKLPRFTLSHDAEKDDWVLREEGAARARRRFETKADATAGGVLGEAVGSEGGSVRIRKLDGVIQEERTFPRGKDPNESPG